MTLVTNKKYPLKVSWSIGDGYGDSWNEICIKVIEKFGLPGDKYTTELANRWIIFNFNTPEDLLLAKLSFGDLEFN